MDNLKSFPMRARRHEIASAMVLQMNSIKCFKYIPERYRTKTLLLTIISKGYTRTSSIPDEFLCNKEVMLKWIQSTKRWWDIYIPKQFKDDRDIVLAAILRNKYIIDNVSPKLYHDREIFLTCIKFNGGLIKNIPPELQNDEKIIMAALRGPSKCDVKKDAPYLLNTINKKIALAIVKNNGLNLGLLNPKFLTDKKMVSTAVNNNGQASQFCSPKLQNNEDIILSMTLADNALIPPEKITESIVKKNPNAIKFASENLRDNKLLMLGVVSKNGLMLQYASSRLQDDRDVVLIAVTQNSIAITYASPELRLDKKLAIIAMYNNDWICSHLDDTLQNDREIVLACATYHKMRLCSLKPQYRLDVEIVLTIIVKSPQELQFVHKSLFRNPDFIREILLIPNLNTTNKKINKCIILHNLNIIPAIMDLLFVLVR